MLSLRRWKATMTTNGKGDRQRPTDKKRFDSNYDDIDWGRSKPAPKDTLVEKKPHPTKRKE